MRNDAWPGQKRPPEAEPVIERMEFRDTAKGGRRGRDGALVRLQGKCARSRARRGSGR
jgi:hypothetical protein